MGTDRNIKIEMDDADIKVEIHVERNDIEIYRYRGGLYTEIKR